MIGAPVTAKAKRCINVHPRKSLASFSQSPISYGVSRRSYRALDKLPYVLRTSTASYDGRMRGKDSGDVSGVVEQPVDRTRTSGLRARRAELIVLLAAIATLGLIAVLLVLTSGRV